MICVCLADWSLWWTILTYPRLWKKHEFPCESVPLYFASHHHNIKYSFIRNYMQINIFYTCQRYSTVHFVNCLLDREDSKMHLITSPFEGVTIPLLIWTQQGYFERRDYCILVVTHCQENIISLSYKKTSNENKWCYWYLLIKHVCAIEFTFTNMTAS